ncbi:hypothetical protein K9L67_01650 [Candidatus Woesearchaeota archaeon]|nr:hypothetical protein [Candidatus Woesearchaeota archaeon]MCF8013043.1 hypothetical protein [Candidatus Woesearchaeota archaeon]
MIWLQTIKDTLSLITQQPDTTALEAKRIQAEQDFLLNKQTKQEQIETKIQNYNNIIQEPQKNGLKLNRFNVTSGNYHLTIDQNPNLENKIQNDVIIFGKNKVYKDLFVNIITNGDIEEEITGYLHTGINTKIGNTKIKIHGGHGLSNKLPKTFIGGEISEENNYHLESVFFSPEPILSNGQKAFFIMTAKQIGQKDYISIGNNDGTWKSIYGHINDKIGTYLSTEFEPNKKEFSFSTTTAWSKPAKNAYSWKGMNFVSQILMIQPFSFPYLSSHTNKGDDITRIEGKISENNKEFTVMQGKNLGLMKIGIGLTYQKKNGEEKYGVVGNIYKEFDITKEMTGTIDLRYNSAKKTLNLWLNTNIEM